MVCRARHLPTGDYIGLLYLSITPFYFYSKGPLPLAPDEMSSQQPGLHPFGWLFAIMLRRRHAPQIPREKARARRLVRLMRRRIFQLQLQEGRFQEQHFQRYESTILDIPPERWPRIFADPTQQPLYAERRLASIHNLNMAMDVWFNAVPDAVEFNERYTSMPKASLPVKGARMVIVP